MEYFISKGHEIVPSSPIVVKNDPTLMFTNAGMNQFKDYFLGNSVPVNWKVADTQKCLRVSGKHNDLEEVGVDTYHHTMFEMLGNWSFGNPSNPASGYFKKEAIAWSWDLLTNVYGIANDRVYVTVFEGDEKENIPKDQEAFDEWKKWIAEERILMGNKKDNFWEMGDTGPCGPCTEIHVDCRTDEERNLVDGKILVNNDHPQVIEIWNNVFIQFNRLKDGSLESLPAKHVDTGMGLERLVRVLQKKTSNYDTDIFTGTISVTEKITQKKYDATCTPDSGDAWLESVSFRVIADHIRAIGFTIADGQLPSNTGAGYVIRRILRRAVRYYYTYLNYKTPLLHQLMPQLAKQFEHVFPELHKQIDFVSKVIKEEEESFLRTLEKGLKRIDDIIQTSSAKNISGKDAFELYDTFGFPIDLTRLIALENGFQVDEAGFELEMKMQKDRSRAATTVDTEDWVVVDSDAKSIGFVGYDKLACNCRLIKYRKVKAKNKEGFQLVLDATVFYAESGGQVGDTGVLIFADESIEVVNTKKENEIIIHFTDTLPKQLTGEVIAKVDAQKRKDITLHHSATHLLHAALRQVLGKHVTQKGSLVNEVHLRFDFAHFAKMTNDEICKVEELVNEKIRANIPVIIKELPKDEAMKLGAMALFGEKYGDTVRVVIIDENYSIELCGGTHIASTGELGLFKIRHETAVAAGVRRLEAVSGKRANNFLNTYLNELNQVKEFLKNPKDLLKNVESLVSENADLKKKLEAIEAKQLVVLKNELKLQIETINGVNFLGRIVHVSNADALKKLCFDLKNELENYFVVLASNIDGKAQMVILIDEKLAEEKNLDAPKIIKEHVAPLIKGGGGGQKTLATAGGQDAENLDLMIEKIKSLI